MIVCSICGAKHDEDHMIHGRGDLVDRELEYTVCDECFKVHVVPFMKRMKLLWEERHNEM